MKKFNDFQADKVRGDAGEDIVFDYLSKREDVKKIIDVANNSEYFKLGVDFLVEMENGMEVSIDAKNDKHIKNTENVFCEYMSNQRYGTKGNFVTSQADYFFTVMEGTDKILLLPLKNVREYVEKNKFRYRWVNCRSSYSGGYLVPCWELIKLVKGVKIECLN